MEGSIHIPRKDWVAETKKLSLSPEEGDAYIELEKSVVADKLLEATYRRNPRGQSHFATFNGSAKGRRSVIQIYGGRCHLMWKSTKPIPGMTREQNKAIREALDRFRVALGGSPERSWEQVNVLSLGTSRIQDALHRVSEELHKIIP